MKKNQFGFSMVEALVGVGLMGGVGLMVMQQQQSSTKSQMRSSALQEVDSIANNLSIILSKKHNCSATVAVAPLDGIYMGLDPSASLNYLSETPTRQGAPIFKVGQEFSKYKIKITEIQMVKKDTSVPGGSDFLRVGFLPEGQPQIVKDFRLTVNRAPAGGAIVSCSSDIGNEIEEGIAQACKAIEGTYDDVTKKCIPTNLPLCFMTEGTCESSGRDDESLYKSSGSQAFKEYDKTTCTTTYRVKKTPDTCRLNSNNRTTSPCTCYEWGCTCVEPQDSCHARFLTCSHLYVTKTLTQCCRSGTSNLPSTGGGSSGSYVWLGGNVPMPGYYSGAGGPDVNGGWSDWSDWACLDKTTQQRSRSCSNPAPAGNGTDCSGSPTETQTASGSTCAGGGSSIDGAWSSWSDWSACANKTQSRSRACDSPAPANGGAPCSGDPSESQSCGESCPPNTCLYQGGGCMPEGNMYDSYDNLTVPCGSTCVGYTRTCNSGAWSNPGHPYAMCSVDACTTGGGSPIDCVWSDWSDWQSLNTAPEGQNPSDCGEARTRSKIGPSNGGSDCPDIESYQRRKMAQYPKDC